MKRNLTRRLLLSATTIAGALLLSGALTSCDIMLDPYAELSSDEVNDLLESFGEVAGELLPDICPVESDVLPNIDFDIDPDYAYDPETEGIPCDDLVTEPPVEIPLPDIDVSPIQYYTTEEVTGLSFTAGYVDAKMYLYGELDKGVLYTDSERLLPGVQVIDSYDQLRALLDMSRKDLVNNANRAETENECSFWTQLSRMTPDYFEEWSLIVVLTPDVVEPFVNSEVRTYPIVSSTTSANITAIDIRSSAALSDKPEAAYAVMIPLYKGLHQVVAEDIVLGFDGTLYIDERLHERVGDKLDELILNFDKRITESPTWPVNKNPDVSVSDVLEKSRMEDGVLHLFLPEDPALPVGDPTVFWVNSADDIPRYLNLSDNDHLQDAMDELDTNPAYAMLQAYLEQDADFFEDQWLVLILLREDSWSISYDTDIQTSRNHTMIELTPVDSGEPDNRRAWWLLAVPVDADQSYTVRIPDLDGSCHVSSYRQDGAAVSVKPETDA